MSNNYHQLDNDGAYRSNGRGFFDLHVVVRWLCGDFVEEVLLLHWEPADTAKQPFFLLHVHHQTILSVILGGDEFLSLRVDSHGAFTFRAGCQKVMIEV